MISIGSMRTIIFLLMQIFPDMKYLKQTKTGIEGNCLAACIANLLSVPIEAVPGYAGYDWFPILNKWLIAHHGQEILIFDYNQLQQFTIDTPVIAVGVSPNYHAMDHAVLWQRGQLLFDPSPTDKGLLGSPSYFLVFKKDIAL